jgi:hypothetical protein
MDEPYRSHYRDYQTNRYSISGHYDFCTAVENGDTRPKMVGIHSPMYAGLPAPKYTTINQVYTGISGAMDILIPNLNDPGGVPASDAWWIPCMSAWALKGVHIPTNKMVMPWLPGWHGETQSFYSFYGSIIEGARGVAWWMKGSNEARDGSDFTAYTHQQTVYSAFTSERLFHPSLSINRPPDREVILSGTDISTSINFSAGSFSSQTFGSNISNVVTAKAFKYDNRWRVFAVNHTTNNQSGSFVVNDTEIGFSNYTNVCDIHRNRITGSINGSYHLVFSASFGSLGYNVFDIGEGN